jgi:hypothetical protein
MDRVLCFFGLESRDQERAKRHTALVTYGICTVGIGSVGFNTSPRCSHCVTGLLTVCLNPDKY